ncbi:carboxymuconolactone decarboxylase family protein [Microbacterium sp. ASV49]|uniref:Carboxymuconolactone decarboxylase family protein n=1 Tax=Microbacterium candidum TaxID=3041922 RepID=A0ABT7MYF7_9MICO|nr:carboxymuconolactone decarboxylase family protein [Microbacterium sp. ASV49]MDL9979466.1 carboxymuconolactone decarboxylase family protein [Microbacterium sp. ASV49]
MTTQTRIPTAEVTGVYGALVKFGAKRMIGRVPDSIGVLWQHPAVMKDSMSIGRKVEGWHELDPNLASYAAMASAATIGCSFCLDFNYFAAHNHGLDDAKIREVPRWRDSTVFSPLERRVMEYAEAASQTPPAVTDDLSDALLADLGPAGLVELAARVAFMNMSARMNVALGIHSEQFADSCGLPPLAARPTALTAVSPAA